MAWSPRPELLGQERHKRMQEPEQAVETEVSNVLGCHISRAQPLLCRFQVPVAKLVPREAIGGSHRVLECESLDALRDGSARSRKARNNTAILEMALNLEEARSFGGRRPGRAEDKASRIPELVAETAVSLNATLVEPNVLARHRDRCRPGADRIRPIPVYEVARVDAGTERFRH